MKNFHFFSILLSVSLLLAACDQAPDTSAGTATADAGTPAKGQSTVNDGESATNVLQVAIGSPDHTTLVAAVQAAGLEDVLVNAGPLTVFAPTNAAFEALPPGTVDDLLKPENKSKLAGIIKYHAAPGNYQGDLLKDGQKLYMASGHYVDVKRVGDDWTVGGAKILGTVQASNGVVHVVDKVMLPPN